MAAIASSALNKIHKRRREEKRSRGWKAAVAFFVVRRQEPKPPDSGNLPLGLPTASEPAPYIGCLVSCLGLA